MAFTSLFLQLLHIRIRYFCSCIHLNDPYIISAVRTPIGRFQGKLASLSAVQLGSKALSAAVERSCIPKEEISELVLGCCFQSGLGQGPARQVALYAGLPNSTISCSVNKICGSGMKAVTFGAQLLMCNSQEVVAVAGTESISNVPYILRRKNLKIGNLCLPDLIIHDGLSDMFDHTDVTVFAEQTVKDFNVTREDQDNYAIKSYYCSAAAQRDGYFSAEMVPIKLKKKGGEEEIVCEDEEIKQLNEDKLRILPPDVGKGTITAGNSSGLHDGAAAMILASGNYILKKNLQPLARIVSFADGAVDPKKFCIAPSVAVPRALVRGRLTPDHISLWEISETFAITAIANTRLLKLVPDRVNIHGGAISLGHPFGMTGVRLIVHLAHVLQSGEYGCATISHATGGATACVIEKI